ncbi:MAG: imidazolonepropionase [Thermoleophilia bacterium]|nr:imidazolonepropionase [Thermoleophilia bacterium]
MQPLATTVIHDIGTLVTPARVPAPVRGADLAAVVEVPGASIAIDGDGVILSAGPEAEVRASIRTDGDTEFRDARGALAIPGLVDCHTHPVFAGDRAAEFELRNLGAGYEEIHAAGGGIRASVAKTRAALDDGSIAPQVRRHLDWMLAAGTTTAEGKSGYALTVEHELESLRVLGSVAKDHPIRLVRTLLAAHTVPVEFDGRPDAYVDEVAIPAARRAKREVRADAADVFLERGSFDAAQAGRYLRAAQAAGLVARMHGDQFSDSGAVELAIELGARSIDHLEALEPDAPRLRDLAASDVAGVLLPTSSLFLNRPYAPGRALVDAGAIVALASDFNPGSSYGESLPLAISLACLGCHLRAGEALTAATVNAAWVLGLADRVGRLDPGYRGDVVLLDQPNLAHLPYHVGSPAVQAVFVGGLEVSGGLGARR